jgi:heme/copper-type cytochrome/quinol oxidase subunit 2
VVVGLTAATAVIAMAARAPLARSTPVDAASARAPTTALFMLFGSAGVVALAALAWFIWPGRRRKSDEFVPERVRVHWLWKLLAIVLPFALGAALVAAAVLGSQAVRTAPRLTGHAGPARPPSALPARPRAAGGGFVLPFWLPWTVLAIVFVAVAAAVVLLRRRTSRADEPSVQSAARAAVQAAIGELDRASDPRSGVIAAYSAMEGTLAAHGIARSPAEAPREYLRRVLVASAATEREARTLTGLFEEARFSAHPISEGVRELALSALNSLRERLPVGGAG